MDSRFANIGAFITTKVSLICSFTAGAGASGQDIADNTKTNGTGVDRYVAGAASNGIYNSLTAFIMAQAKLAASKVLTVKLDIQESADDGVADAYASIAAAQQPGGAADTVDLTLTDSGAGSTLTGKAEFDINLEGNKRYVRAAVTGDLNAANTDTARVCVGFVMGGVTKLPVT